MQEQKRIGRMKVPATIAGVALGLLVGIVQVIKDLVTEKSPTFGIIIVVVTPVLVFIFEQAARIIFPTFYRDKIAGFIYFCWRRILNESFYLNFRYELEFPGAQEMDAHQVCETIGAGPGQEPRYDFLGENFVQLQYSNINHYILVKWNSLPIDADDNMDNTDEQNNWSYIVTLKPAVQVMGMRNSQKQLEALANRVTDIRDRLVNRILPLPNGLQMEEHATVKAWLRPDAKEGESEESLFVEETDKISEAKVKYNRQWVPVTWVQLTGKKSSVLTAVYRWLKILET